MSRIWRAVGVAAILGLTATTAPAMFDMVIENLQSDAPRIFDGNQLKGIGKLMVAGM